MSLRKTDLVADYHQLRKGTHISQQSPHFLRWLERFEVLVLQFMDLIFHKPIEVHFEDPNPKDERRKSSGPGRGNNAPGAGNRFDIDDTLEQIHEMMEELAPEIVSSLQPTQANMIFLNRHSYFMIEHEEGLRILETFRAYIAFATSDHAQASLTKRLKKLNNFVDSVRRISDFLLADNGYTEFGKSQRKILFDLQTKKETVADHRKIQFK